MNSCGIEDCGDYCNELRSGRRVEKQEREQAKKLADERKTGNEVVFLLASTKTVVEIPGEGEVEIQQTDEAAKAQQ